MTWQKRTNLEEHQQFFSKINEIIRNLKPVLEESEAAIATANAASAAASAAATQAQTVASTVAGFENALTAVEGRIDTAEGDITAIEGRETGYLKKTGAAQTVTAQIMVPTTATGTRDTQIANGTRIQNDLDNYTAMIRNTGNQSKAGVMTFENRVNGTIMHSFRVASYGYSGWIKALNMGSINNGVQTKVTVFTSSYRTPNQYAELFVSNNATPQLIALMCKGDNEANASPSNFGVMADGNDIILYVKKNSSDMAITINVEYKTAYGDFIDPGVTNISEHVSDPTGSADFVVATKLIDG